MSFNQYIVLVVVTILGIVAVRISFSFNVNKYLERKDKKLNQKLTNACTHLSMRPLESGEFEIFSFFESPVGTTQWQCQRCGIIKNHNNDFEKQAEYFAKNPASYLEFNKKFSKLLKKTGMA